MYFFGPVEEDRMGLGIEGKITGYENHGCMKNVLKLSAAAMANILQIFIICDIKSELRETQKLALSAIKWNMFQS